MSKSRLALTLLTLVVFAAGLGIFNVATSDAQVRPDPEARNRRLLPILGLQGVVFTDYDETRGRLVIGVENRNNLYYAVQAQLKSLGIASDDIDVVETRPIYNVATLRDQQRPLAAGLQIRFDGFLCTLGFNAVRNGVNGFVTNSHCSTNQGGVDGTQYYQPLDQVSDQFIGTEIVDPVYQAGICPAGFSGKTCRYSDSIFVQRAAGVAATLGMIEKTTGANNADLTIAGSFTITGEGTANNGDTVNKVGRTTGWSQAPVTGTCVNVNVSGTDFTELCQTMVIDNSKVLVQGGDSGSPVFKIVSGNNVELVGILWGGSTDGHTLVYSPMTNIEDELGALTTFNGASTSTPTNTPPAASTSTKTPTPVPTNTPVQGGVFSDSLEGSTSGWSTSGLWHLVNNTSCVSPGYESATHAFYYGQDGSCNYNVGGLGGNSGALTSPQINGLGSTATLSFWYYRNVEGTGFFRNNVDTTSAEVSYDNGSTWTTVWTRNNANASENAWTQASIPLSTGGSSMRVRFSFNSGDRNNNSFKGWLIDDVVVASNGGASATSTATRTPTATGTATRTPTATGTATRTPTATNTALPGTSTATPTRTNTPLPTATGTNTPVASSTPTATATVSGSLFSDKLEGSTSGWATTGLWHLATNTNCISPGYKSATHAFYYGMDSGCNYNSGGIMGNSGTLTSPQISGLSGQITLSFWYYRNVEGTGAFRNNLDTTTVQVSYDNGSTWTTVWSKSNADPSENTWTQASINLTAGGSNMRVRFTFNSGDRYNNGFKGWFIDDLSVTSN